MAELDYTWEKLYQGLVLLIGSTGSLQKRLGEAYCSELHLIESPNGEALLEIRKPYQELKAALTREESKEEEGQVAATTERMSDEEARRLGRRIVDMFDTVCRLMSP